MMLCVCCAARALKRARSSGSSATVGTRVLLGYVSIHTRLTANFLQISSTSRVWTATLSLSRSALATGAPSARYHRELYCLDVT